MRAAALCLVATLVAAASAFAQDERPRAVLASSVATGFPVSETRVLDVDGDGSDDLLVVGVAGEVRVWRHDPETGALAAKPAGSLVLANPDRALLAVADVLGGGERPQLVVLTREGVLVHRVDADGSFARGAENVAPRTRLSLRIGRPRFADIARDVNGDARPDLVVPRGDVCELWLHAGAPAGETLPSFAKAASIRVALRRATSTRAEALSDVLESSFRIPDLAIADVNGDARRDLVVEDGKHRAWHLQRADGAFPADADVSLDLETFRDTTPEATVKLGKTLAGGDEQRMETRDLDGDGIPDYVIAHRRKVWVFHGTGNGPQFTDPSDVLRVADDVTMLLLLALDDDPHPDLLLLRVQMPTVGTLLRGLVAAWEVEIGALGYAAQRGGRRFETTPRWRGSLAVRLPSILGILKDPDALLRRFEDVSRKFRQNAVGDFDGDARADVALLSEKGDVVEVYAGVRRETDDAGGDRAIGEVFFGEEGRVWELDAVLAWLGDVAQRITARRTGGAPPVARFALRESPFERTGFATGDTDGDGRDEVIVVYDRGGEEAVVDVVGVR